ncbi:MAG TPA: hypothetical protein VFL93_17050 [Longimicrobiaceae bacterium]|nr:hypothetical protein [Longimicrobiaceae bacterium]
MRYADPYRFGPPRGVDYVTNRRDPIRYGWGYYEPRSRYWGPGVARSAAEIYDFDLRQPAFHRGRGDWRRYR